MTPRISHDEDRIVLHLHTYDLDAEGEVCACGVRRKRVRATIWYREPGRWQWTRRRPQCPVGAARVR